MSTPRDGHRQTPDGIELRHLRAFVAVADELSFSRAALRLYLTQPTLSRQIRALEKRVGCDLLRRDTHTVELTLAGEALLASARQLLAGLDEAITAARALGGELNARMGRLWAPVQALHDSSAGLDAIRSAYETMCAQLPVPPEVEIHPVNSGGVAGLMLTPPSAGSTTILYAHGGGMALGSAYGYRALAAALALAAGAAAVLPEYRLAPEHPYPAAVDDIERAYRWLLARGLPPQQIVMAGDSTGGMLLISVLYRLTHQGTPLPRCAVLLCPGADFFAAEAVNPDDQAMVAEHRRFQAAYLNGHPLDDPAANPLRADLTGFPPMLIQAAAGDQFTRGAHELAERARRYGVPTTEELYPVSAHDFQSFWSFLPEAADALRHASQFIRGCGDAMNGDDSNEHERRPMNDTATRIRGTPLRQGF
jgi:epsilon-lactone hydrolase